MHVYGKTVSYAVSYLDKRSRERNVCTSLPSWQPTDPLTRSAVLPSVIQGPMWHISLEATEAMERIRIRT